MEDRVLVEALRSRDLGAIGDLYDVYAERLYAYCWFRLRGRDAAQVAVRDSFIVAETHIGKLRDAQDLAAWLYAVARLECARRLPVLGSRPDIPVASHDQYDVDRRLIAWRSVNGIDPLSQELLDLSERHGFGPAQIAAVIGLPVKAVRDLLDQARNELDAALTAELLAHDGPYGCSDRAALLQQRRGELTSELRTKLLHHARECLACGGRPGATANRPAASPAKVYALLPQAKAPHSLRARVLACITDPDLATYRRFVATRQDTWHPSGFPAPTPLNTPKSARFRALRTLLSKPRPPIDPLLAAGATEPPSAPDATASPERPGSEQARPAVPSGLDPSAPHPARATNRPAAAANEDPFETRQAAGPIPDPMSSAAPLSGHATHEPPAASDSSAPTGHPSNAQSALNLEPSGAIDHARAFHTRTSDNPRPSCDRRTAAAGPSAPEANATIESASPLEARATDGESDGGVSGERGFSAGAGGRGSGGVRRVGGRRGKGLIVVVVVVVGVVGAGVGVSWLVSGIRHEGRVAASGERPGGSWRPRLDRPSPTPVWDGRAWAGSVPISPTFPLGATGSSAPPTALPSPPARVHQNGPGGSGPGAPGGAGVLLVSPLFLDVGTGPSGTIRLQAQGGRLSWRADVHGPMRLSNSAGTLEDGQSADLHVVVLRAPGSHGQGSITFAPGGQSITVTWREQPPPQPSPSDPPPGPSTSPPSQSPPSQSPSPPGRQSPPESSPPPQSPSPGPDPAPAPPPSAGQPPSGPAPKASRS